MPIWAFLEVVTFGTLLAFYLFCSRRWDDGVMRGSTTSSKASRRCGIAALTRYVHLHITSARSRPSAP